MDGRHLDAGRPTAHLVPSRSFGLRCVRPAEALRDASDTTGMAFLRPERWLALSIPHAYMS